MWTMVVYLLCFSPGLGPVPWAVASEIFPVKGSFSDPLLFFLFVFSIFR